MKQKSVGWSFKLLLCFLLVLQCHLAYGAGEEDFPVGSQLPELMLPAPDSPEVQTYLGLKANEPFALSEVDGKVVLIEFLSALCPRCHKNAPIVNRLYKVVQSDPRLGDNLKFIGIAVGNTDKQRDAYKQSFKVPFPIFSDDGYALTGPMGGVDTPTMVVVTKNGKVLDCHRGLIKDFDGYLKELREIVKKQ